MKRMIPERNSAGGRAKTVRFPFSGKLPKRVLSLLLCVCMTASLLCNFGGWVLASAVAAGATETALNRLSDDDTTDTYIGKLLSSEWGSRYAGRVWTDKSVFAFGNNNNINLDTETDGYDGVVKFQSDFGTVFSALASSQRINEYPPSPLDVVILIDMSGSMAADIENPNHTHNDYDDPNGERITHSRIYAVLESINKTIQDVMDMGEADRVAVVGYGATAYTLLELGHYKTPKNGKYLEVSHFRQYYITNGDERAPSSKGSSSASYLVGTVTGLTKLNESTGKYVSYSRYARNDYKSTKFSCDPDGTINIGFHTDLQAGIYQGFEELYKHYNTASDVTEVCVTGETKTEVVVQRIPVGIVMTDGGSNFALQPTTGAKGDEWYNVPIVKNNVSSYTNVSWKKYRTEALGNGLGGDATILDILLTASYEKMKVEKKYVKLVQDAKSAEEHPLEEDRAKEPVFRILTVSVDTPDNEWQKPRVYAALDPVHFFNEDPQANGTIDPSKWTQRQDAVDAYTLFQKWVAASGPISTSFNDSDSGTRTVTFNQPPAKVNDYDVTKEDIINNINYNTRFADISSSALSATFDEMLNEVRGIAFTPLKGDNASGVADSITYKDPLGEYMEFKNGAISVERATDEKGNLTGGVVTGSNKDVFDMSMLLFGEMHGMVRAGVYDYQWNDKYMTNHSEGVHGQDPFPMGWYKGEDAATAYKADKNKMKYDDSGSWPSEDPKTGKRYATAEEAWEDGWVMRFDFKTLLDFVPIANAPKDNLPNNLDESVKNTVYTCYRFADSQKDRNVLRRNPIFGDVPDTLQKDWQDYYNLNGSYPVGMGMYSGYSGVYRLSDLRVWTEHTGDFIAQSGSMTPEDESQYDDALFLNIPISTVPTQLAEITLGGEGAISYKDNLADKTQSTPLRLFYAVGLTEDLIQRDSDGNQTGVDVSKISGEYIATHSDPKTNNIYFISNWYSNTPYTGYASDEGAYRTRGDAAVSFSPNEKNRYYLFQKALPLIAHAYRVTDEEGNVAPVDRAADQSFEKDGSGNGKTTWENGQIASNWSGGEFIGSYTNQETFQTALARAMAEDPVDGVRYITDEKGYSYPLPRDIRDAVLTYLGDQLTKVDSDGDGYTSDSLSFSSDDYFFLCVEYYMPMDGVGKDVYGKPAPGTKAVCKVYRMIARKGSAFGSELHSEFIGNGDMLCWSDIKGNCTIELEYNSRSVTGDDTRGRPTLEKLTLQGSALREYLQGLGLHVEPEVDGQSYLDLDYAYWTGIQQDSRIKPLIEEITALSTKEARQKKFDELFDWSVAARTGGIRVGDMFNNMQAKSGELIDGFYEGNKTQTANNYYIPTLSEKSTAGNGLVINNFLGNNGRMEIANANLMVTKTLVVPNGFELTKEQKLEDFYYQAYLQGVTGERLAQRVIWNPLSHSWQKRVESLDILNDNSSLLIDANGSRALFCCADGDTENPRQIVEVVEDDGSVTYHYANEDGSASVDVCDDSPEHFYYLYLPSNPSGSDLTYHLFGSKYEGYGDDGGTTEKITGAGTTAYYAEGTDVDGMAHNENQTFKEETADRPAGSREYWTMQAELIPYEEVRAIESGEVEGEGGSSTFAAQATESGNRWDHDQNHGDKDNHKPLKQFVLVTVIPDQNGVESKVLSPFSSRTQYMTTPLYFGYTAALTEHLKETNETFATCTHTDDYKLQGTDLYDSVIPTDTRSDLFNGNRNKNNDTADKVARNTAEFTLRTGEGLLFTGLGSPFTYRFTEHMTAAQLEQGCFLQDIEHVQQESSAPGNDRHIGDDDYSVYGDTGYITEQVNYTNAVDPDLFVLVKKMEDKNGEDVPVAPDKDFTFTVTFEPADRLMTKADSTLHYWKGSKDYTSALKWTDSDGVEYAMPPTAPQLNAYEPYLTGDTYRLKTIEPDKDTEYTYTITLKANEAIVFYGLIAGTKFTVTETKNDKYPVVPGKNPENSGYTQSGTILRASETSAAFDPKLTPNRAEFTNLLKTGILTVEKRIKDDEPDAAKDFGFTITLNPVPDEDVSNLEVTKYKADGTAYGASEFAIEWKASGNVRTAEITLKHGEKLLIEGIPIDAVYTVEESQRDGYNLQHVADNPKDAPLDDDGNYLPLTNNRVTGTITTDKAQAYLLFVNEKAPLIPFAGGIGVVGITLIGALLIGAATTRIVLKKYKRRRNARIGG